MISGTTTLHLDAMLLTLYVLLEAGYLLHYSRLTHHSSAQLVEMKPRGERIEEWKRELASHGLHGASSVNAWVNGWFDSLDQSGPRGYSQDVKRGNVETYLSERVFGLDLKEVLDSPTKHHCLIRLVSNLELKRNRRFPSGLNTDLRLSPLQDEGRKPYRPLIFRFIAILYSLLQEMFDRSQTASIARSFGSSKAARPFDERLATERDMILSSKPSAQTTIRPIPQSSISMASSLSNLSSIGLCAAPPLRTRQRSRTIEAVISAAQTPVSSLAMMSSMSNLSSIGMCAAPPLRTRQRSRSSVVGYASAVPFASRKFSGVSR